MTTDPTGPAAEPTSVAAPTERAVRMAPSAPTRKRRRHQADLGRWIAGGLAASGTFALVTFMGLGQPGGADVTATAPVPVAATETTVAPPPQQQIIIVQRRYVPAAGGGGSSSGASGSSASRSSGGGSSSTGSAAAPAASPAPAPAPAPVTQSAPSPG